MDERGFDALQQGNGPMLVLWATILLAAFIVGGGLWLRHMEQKAREKERLEKEARDPSNGDSPRAV